MKLLADENVDGAVVERLRGEGYDVAYVADLDRGITDENVVTWARDAGRVLLTEDTDFGELVVHHGYESPGVVLARLGGLSLPRKGEEISRALRDHAEALAGNPAALVVVDPGRVRVHQPQGETR